MHRFRVCLLGLILIVLLWTQQTRAQENLQQQESPIFESENRFDLSIELGPAFIRGPVLKQSEFFSGTRLMYKQPRYIGLEFSQRVLRYLRLGWGVNFTSVNLKGAQGVSGIPEYNRNIEALQYNLFVHPNVVSPIASLRTASENGVIRAQPEYTAALTDDCNDSCALAAARTGIGEDQTRSDAVNALLDGARDQISQNTEIIPAVNQAIENNLLMEDFSSERFSAQGTFFALDSFLSIYVDYPIIRDFSIYGGGGVGLSWSRIRKGGEVSRSFSVALSADTQSNLETDLQTRLEALPIFDSVVTKEAVEAILRTLTGSITQLNYGDRPRSISYSSLSYSVMAAVGFRTQAFEGLTIDTGYRMMWTPDLYSDLYRKNNRGQLIHQVRLGFVFNF